ncbi:MAG TPA: phosphate acetyltransferase [Elusimicrobiales bacterium]|nr:phosphate acetyltransferase [Elusimicrobiales bacterium]HOL63048.1 phosphate acetyltransferase [Elusimicrobiales bacterium]HPO95343.1 phosphate acetyltransferase [Elusimicrobiales bacterium]
MTISDFLRKKAALKPKRILFPESDDERIIKAAIEISNLKIAIPILLSDKKIEGLDTLDENDGEMKKRAVCFVQETKKISEEEAKSFISNKINFATVLVYLGYADALVAGANTSTADTLKPSLYLRKLYPGVPPVTSCFFMETKLNGENKTFVFSDCALNPEPSPAMLAQISNSAAKAAKNILDIKPYVALLSFSTKQSANSPSVEKVRTALEIAKSKFPDLIIDGEMQADAAIIDWIGEKKAPNSPVAGKANVLIFPDLNSGNIAYKLVERLANAKAIGPIILGLNPPVNDLSRGCSVDDIIDVTAVSSIQGGFYESNI